MVTPFGTLCDGTAVEAVTLSAHGLTARFITWGAALQDLRLDGHEQALVLGLDNLADYVAHSRHFGATAGPCANRIANGRAGLDGRTLHLDKNFMGRHHLHGGREGTGKLVWSIDEAAGDAVRLSLRIADGHMGYPGPMALAATFSLVAPSTLDIVYEATSTAPTLGNLAHHSYFNLGGDTVLNHELHIAADTYLPVDEGKIPLGPQEAVAGTVFDFRTPRLLGATPDGAPPAIDHNFCLAPARRTLTEAARVRSAQSGVGMTVRTTEPGLQVYDGHQLDVPVAGLDGRRMGAHAGLALETQVWPDSPNHPGYPSAILRPGETYHHHTQYAFWKEPT